MVLLIGVGLMGVVVGMFGMVNNVLMICVINGIGVFV